MLFDIYIKMFNLLAFIISVDGCLCDEPFEGYSSGVGKIKIKLFWFGSTYWLWSVIGRMIKKSHWCSGLTCCVLSFSVSVSLPGFSDALLIRCTGQNATIPFTTGVGGHPLHLYVCHWENTWGIPPFIPWLTLYCMHDHKLSKAVYGIGFEYLFLTKYI